MIKVKKNRVKIKGNERSLLLEIGAVIKCVYEAANEESPNLAELFKENLIALVADTDSPLWEGRKVPREWP